MFGRRSPILTGLLLAAAFAAGCLPADSALAAGLPSSAGQLVNPASGLGQGVTSIASTATTDLGLAAIGTWVSDAASATLHETADVLDETTAPRLDSTWFSTAYWRVAGIAAVLTLPFLFAASVQALIRSDLGLLLRAALGYLPLAMLAVGIAAPITMLMLSASDELAAAVSSAAGHQSVSFLDGAVGPLGAIGVISGSPFLGLLMALFTVAGALMLWMELLMREAAVYVIVLLLPLVFAAFVWPARRIWVLRSVEVLMALVLSKFAIVAVLSLGGAALAHGVNGGFANVMAGVVLLVLGAFAPWALLRLFPLAEIASGTAGALRGHSGSALSALHHADDWATAAQRWVATTAQMRRTADAPATGRRSSAAEPSPEDTEETWAVATTEVAERAATAPTQVQETNSAVSVPEVPPPDVSDRGADVPLDLESAYIPEESEAAGAEPTDRSPRSPDA